MAMRAAADGNAPLAVDDVGRAEHDDVSDSSSLVAPVVKSHGAIFRDDGVHETRCQRLMLDHTGIWLGQQMSGPLYRGCDSALHQAPCGFAGRDTVCSERLWRECTHGSMAKPSSAWII